MDYQQRSFRNYPHEARLFVGRAWVAVLLIALLFLVLLGQLFRLQIIDYERYRTESRDNRVKLRPLSPTRGQIFDRNGVALAVNRLNHSLEIVPQHTDSFDDTIERLGQVVRITEEDLERFQRLRRQRRRFDNIPIRTRLDQTELARFAVQGHLFPEVVISAVPTREYPLKTLASHLVGYVGRISDQDLERINPSDYAGTSHVGKAGLEKSYEGLLHGSVGMQREEVNAVGRPLRILEREPPVTGRNLHLYLDTRIQEIARTALGEYNGAIVAIEVETGGVIAMVSKPGFDPNLFVDGISNADYQALLNSPDTPLFNRAIKGQYPPASTIKPFIGWAALFSGSIEPEEKISCPGYFQLPKQEHRYRCWNRWGHGPVNLLQAIANSCDVYFYDLAVQMGIDQLNLYLQPFGFGQASGIDLPGESPGLLPSRDWKEATYGKPWYPGETVIAGIGQGYFLTTPLQLASATATLASGGVRREPKLVRAVDLGSTVGKPVALRANSQRFDMDRQHSHALTVQAMDEVVQGKLGTAKGIRNSNYRIAGKTGTAQVFGIKQDETYDKETLARRLLDHALFIAFAPVERPRIAVAVVVENGESGGKVAAPISKRVMDAYLLGPEYDELDEGLPPTPDNARSPGPTPDRETAIEEGYSE
ncbi:MAG: penicillin-binding protein 2 [Gammaproteobacteria bacterium SHHR-1]|uniref:penicillin-binding protein 2 n=1 Tax=Magnetovirga frankeli TaxID=947516 RepID=UPI00129409A7|nr:penicillin-binding protein 2 [gamma proteobacterium SS-5]